MVSLLKIFLYSLFILLLYCLSTSCKTEDKKENKEPLELVRFFDYDEGIKYAKENNKRVMLDFSGYGCVNNRKMESIVWANEEVNKILAKYVIISLMVDDREKLSEPITIELNGRSQVLRTVGDKWSYFQSEKFGTNAQPYYVILDHKEKQLGKAYGYNENIDAYIEFLQSGLIARK